MSLGCLSLLSGCAPVSPDGGRSLCVRAETFDIENPVNESSSSLAGMSNTVRVEDCATLWCVTSSRRVMLARLSPRLEVCFCTPMSTCDCGDLLSSRAGTANWFDLSLDRRMSLVATASGHCGAVSSGRGVPSVVSRSSPVGMLSDPLVPPPCGVFCVADAARGCVGCKASSSPEGITVSVSSAPLLRAVEVTQDREVREAASPLRWVYGTTQCCGVALSLSLLSGVAAVRVESSLLRMPGAVGSPCVGGSAPFGRVRVAFSGDARPISHFVAMFAVVIVLRDV